MQVTARHLLGTQRVTTFESQESIFAKQAKPNRALPGTRFEFGHTYNKKNNVA